MAALKRADDITSNPIQLTHKETITMFKHSSDDKNNGNDGFVWSGKATMVVGFLFALALAAARFAPVLAVPLEWQH
jgi:hypothetical protein